MNGFHQVSTGACHRGKRLLKNSLCLKIVGLKKNTLKGLERGREEENGGEGNRGESSHTLPPWDISFLVTENGRGLEWTNGMTELNIFLTQIRWDTSSAAWQLCPPL